MSAKILAMTNETKKIYYFRDDERIEQLVKPVIAGDQQALEELQEIYDRGEFDPSFGRELEILLPV